jgi:hypothetical protein
MKIIIKDVLNSDMATSKEDGKIINKIILDNLDKEIILDFKDINLVNSAFLRSSIGELYLNKELWDKLDAIKYENIDEDDLELLKTRIIPLYKNYSKIEKSQKEFYDEIQD